VGIGCRFPGASDLRAFWSLLANGVDAIGEIPPDRFRVDDLYDATPATPGRISTRWGGFLSGLDGFDAQFFGIAPREATHLDPQQRILLEVAWEALEDAGIPAGTLAGSRTAVFIGLWVSDFEMRLARAPKSVDVYTSTGSGRHSASGRLSFAFGLEGPSLTIDAACSSGLAAVHLGCQSIWTGESSLALAGGANVILEPFITMAYSQAKMMAPDGRCKFGDASANGYVRSEGAGVLVLKPLSQALADRDPIHAVIRGSSVNNNGRSSGFLPRPAQHGHEQMLRQAYESAGVRPADVQYVEAHGTGTIAGDPVELQALGAVLAEGRAADQPCLVGSVKTNIGHTEAAAGIAGITKVALALEHAVIPASLHFHEPSARIPWTDLPLRIPTTSEPWPDGLKRVAGVSAFGISGTNAHVVLEAAPPPSPRADEQRGPHLLVFSARSPESLQALLGSYRALLADGGTGIPLADLCGWAAGRRDHHPHRIGVVASDHVSLAAHLDAADRSETHPLVARSAGPAYVEPGVAFVFPGQGGQWLGMGRELMSGEPVFRAALDECDAAIRRHAGWSVIDELHGDVRLDRIDVIQPTIFAVQVSIAALWRSWGIEPAAVIGHSMGEVAAAAVAGALSVDDAARVICARSALMRRLSGAGAMGVVGLSHADTFEALRGYERVLSVAASNSGSSTVVSGDPRALDELFATLQAREVFCRLVKVDVASHSPQMDAIAEELLASLHGIEPRRAGVAMYSTVLGRIIDGTECDGAYWMSNLRQPVLFASSVQQALADGVGAMLEISPHPVLESALTEAARDHGRDVAVVVSTRREQDEREAMLGALGSLYVAGCRPEWDRISPVGGPVALPTYPWQRERFPFEVEAEDSAAADRSRGPGTAGRIESSLHPGTSLWPVDRVTIGDDGLTLVRLMVDTARELADGAAFELSSVEIAAPGSLAAAELQRTAVWSDEGRWGLRIAERLAHGWIIRCSAEARRLDEVRAASRDASADAEPVETSVTAAQAPLDAGFDLLMSEARRWLGAECRVARIGSLSVGSGSALAGARCFPRLVKRGVEAELDLTDEDGALVASFSAVSMEPIDPVGAARASSYELDWERVPLASAVSPSQRPQGATLILSAADDRVIPLVRQLRESQAIVHVTVGDRFAALTEGEYTSAVEAWNDLEDVAAHWTAHGGASIARVVYVAGNTPIRDGDETERLVTGSSDSTLRLGFLVQWLTHTGRSGAVPLCVVTSGVWSVDGAVATENGIAHAPVWGMTRTIVRAHPELTCASVDTSCQADEAEMASLATLLRGTWHPLELVFRSADVFVPRFQPLGSGQAAGPLELRGDATYLLTGGLGNVALELAGRMVARGARHLVLVGRRALMPDDEAHVAALEAAGAKATVIRADVSRLEDVRRVLSVIDSTMPPLAGIVHAAGVIDDAPGQWNRTQLNSVLSAKADGAWHLHLLTRDRPLDFFVLCSSIIASLAQPGDGTYAAANAFLDALAVHRRSRGLPAASVEWGLWAGTGAAMRAGALRVARNWLREGVGMLAPPVALSAFELLLRRDAACTLVTPIDRRRFLTARDGDDARGLFARLREDLADPQAPQGAAPLNLDDVPPAERKALIRQRLREQLALVLRMDVARVDPERPLGTVGLDSLLAVEFVRRVSTALGVKLAATTLFSYPSLAALEAEILRRFEAPSSGATNGAGEVASVEADRTVEAVAAMSEEDAILALMGNSGTAP
jgi:myxalamid-type polyketide synthase MxaE and MxaD